MKKTVSEHNRQTRRRFVAAFSGIGLSGTLLPGVLWARLQEKPAPTITLEMVKDAAGVAGLDFTTEECQMILEDVNLNLARFQTMRQTHLDNSVPPPLYFNPLVPGMTVDRTTRPFRPSTPPAVRRPANLEEVAFWPLTHLAHLIRTQQVRSVELTEMYLSRLKRFNPQLNCVVTLTDDRAMKQARQVDAEIASGRYKGPLHGIPWGAKDIIAAKGYPTTWGAEPFKDQVIDHDATVVERLDQAGAVLVAKLSTGELAFGDDWFGGRTNNPWNPAEGSSGSSAGSASATAAGLVGFAIGTDTGGSILSPSTVCGVASLRPTFGRVSRSGVMAAGFSLDKIGPMCRMVEDCAIVLHAIAGPDGKDLAVPHDVPFNWQAAEGVPKLRVGYFGAGFENEKREEWKTNGLKSIDALRSLGFDLRRVDLPTNDLNYLIEYVERAAGFDEFARGRKDAHLRRKHHRAELRYSHLVPGVEYLQANRIRMLLMREMAQIMSELDAVVATYESINPLTSMTGHPVIAVPNGFAANGTPTGITFVGQVYKEAELIAVARAYQNSTDFHTKHPPLKPGA